MTDVQVVALAVTVVALLGALATAYYLGWESRSATITSLEKEVVTYRAALEREQKEAKRAAASRRDMVEADRARADALAAGDMHDRLEGVLKLFPRGRQPEPPADPSAPHA